MLTILLVHPKIENILVQKLNIVIKNQHGRLLEQPIREFLQLIKFSGQLTNYISGLAN
jgi:hypothetical protein